jgi:hypothetical protein
MIPTLQLGQFGIGGGQNNSRGHDPSYVNNVLLDLWQGTNGATTFTDSSATPATLTGTNSAALSNAKALTGGVTSLLLNGTNQHITTNKACGIGTGVFTFDVNFIPNAASTGRLISSQDSGSPNAIATLRAESTGSVRFLMRAAAGGTLVDIQSSTGLLTMDGSVAYHVAVTRDATNRIDVWLNGASVANGTSAINPNPPGGIFYNFGSQYASAEWFAGYLLACRVTEGVCRYTGTFTPPTALADYPTH